MCFEIDQSIVGATCCDINNVKMYTNFIEKRSVRNDLKNK